VVVGRRLVGRILGRRRIQRRRRRLGRRRRERRLVMDIVRFLKHLFIPDWATRRAFPSGVASRIAKAIRESERQHLGELRFVVEGGLPVRNLFQDKVRKRAEELFAQLGVWDTEHNSGVLIYVQLVDRRIEIVADRGIAARVAEAEWSAVCRAMEKSFRDGRFAEGALEAIERCTALLARHFPSSGGERNELPDRPVLL
jgi:uncharacterized membrane protein